VTREDLGSSSSGHGNGPSGFAFRSLVVTYSVGAAASCRFSSIEGKENCVTDALPNIESPGAQPVLLDHP
jgi:hypothetical protein